MSAIIDPSSSFVARSLAPASALPLLL